MKTTQENGEPATVENEAKQQRKERRELRQMLRKSEIAKLAERDTSGWGERSTDMYMKGVVDTLEIVLGRVW
jgi:hypothetical protein